MKTKREKTVEYLLLLPALLMIGVFILYPLAANFGFSFQQFTLGARERQGVGWANYQHMFHDEVVRTALLNNLRYAIVSVALQVGLSHILAATVLTVLPKRLANVARSFFFVPVLLSITVVAILFTFIFDSGNGLLNSALTAVGLDGWAKPWLGDTDTAIYSIITVSQWQSIGYTMLLFIVSMQAIPDELYESASLEGAGLIQRYWRITVPQTREMIFVVMVLTVSGAFTVFSEPYIMTGGGPGNSSQVLATYMYQQGFFQNQMGYASALAVLMLLITLVLSIAQSTLFRTGKD